MLLFPPPPRPPPRSRSTPRQLRPARYLRISDSFRLQIPTLNLFPNFNTRVKKDKLRALRAAPR